MCKREYCGYGNLYDDNLVVVVLMAHVGFLIRNSVADYFINVARRVYITRMC